MTEKAASTPTGTVTFLFTDIEGSTALHENYPDQMYSALKRHDEILRNNIESCAGYVFNTVGDAFCAAFTTAREAVRAALSAQRALVSEEWPENVTLRVRMGLHTGVAEESEGDYHGPPVNRVARLMSTGHGGQILLSDATHNLVRDALVHMEAEAELQYLGEHRLKDLRHTERIFQLVVPDLPKEFEPLRTHGLITPEEVINLERRYRRIRYLGGGGFGDVYLVRHEALDRDMALKVLGRQHANDEQFKERFKREAKSAASLNHPNVVQVYDAGEGLFEGRKASYIAMEYVPGGTLEDLIAQQGGPLPPRVAAELTLQVAKALEAAHRNGVIHRDIKPQNILLTESGEAKVSDFGIARATGSSTKLTQTGFLLGTLHYLAPELCHGRPASAQSDFYALGVVLYQMLTGELPFDAETPAAIMIKHITEPLRSPKEANPNVPERLNAVVVRLLAKEPEERYPDAAALIEDLLEQAPRSMEYAETVGDTIPGATLPPLGVRVPDLAGKDASRASDTLAEAGLELGDREEVPSETVPEGEIIEQSPEAGTEVEPGSSVSVTVSTGPSTVEVPYLAGLDRSEVISTLAEAGLKLGGQNEAPDDDAPEGEIVEQEPAAGTKANLGSCISITVSSGPRKVTVPGLTGKKLARARDMLAKAGLSLGSQSRASSETVPEGEIIGQDPPPGTEVEADSLVRVRVSSGPSTVEVPDLTGQRLARARIKLANAGLKLGSENEAPSDTILEGGIIEQSPEAGRKAEPGSPVSVTVSSGLQKVAVPDLSGQSLSQARGNLAKAGLSLGAQTEAPSETVAASRIIEQNPAAGMRVRRGDTVRVTVSSGSLRQRDTDRGAPTAEDWNNKGVALRNLGRYEEAIEAYERAIRIKPDDHVVRNNKGLTLNDLGRYEEAIEAYERAIRIKPDDHRPWNNKGNTLDEQGRYEEAIEAYDRATKIKPDDHRPWNNKGLALYNLGRYEEAIEAYDRATKIKPDDHVVWNNKGLALERLGRHAEAKKPSIEPEP